jgi:transaldolase
MDQLEQLKQFTTVVSDTGDFESIQKYHPTDATTNPSLLYTASQLPQYQSIVQEVKKHGKNQPIAQTIDRLFVHFGLEILKIIPGRVSTEIDARLSFEINGSIQRAKHIISLYEQAGIDRKRILIKLASTWEGIAAAKELEKEGIHCNMTLLFSLTQAIACADANVTLISPFVGRILDWHKKNEPQKTYKPSEDPGVESVSEIYCYYKKFGHKTQIMGASFRNKDEITELAGCDLLTIAPSLLEELKSHQGLIERKLTPQKAKASSIRQQHLSHSQFLYALNRNAMAYEKLGEGIRNFVKDLEKLEAVLT